MFSFLTKTRRKSSNSGSQPEASTVNDRGPERTSQTAHSDLYEEPEIIQAAHFTEQRHSDAPEAPHSSRESRSRHRSPDSQSSRRRDPRDLERENAKLRERLQEYEAHFEGIEQHYTEQATAVQRASELTQIIQEKDRIIVNIQEQEAELRRALVFLTSEDRCSAADVADHVQTLNYEILQVATAIAEHVGTKIPWTRNREVLGGEHKDVVERVQKLIGSRFVQALATFNHKDPTLLQLAFQAVLCMHCRYFIKSWDGEYHGEVSQQLDAVYENMKGKEPQSVFARWRTLTASYLNSAAKERERKTLATVLAERVFDVIIVSNIQHPDLSNLWNSFLVDKLRTIESRANRVKSSIDLEFVSADLAVAFIRRRQPFHCTEMRETFQSDEHIEGDTVVCTTELGLKMTKKVVKGEDTREEKQILLKPQVLRDTSLRELIRS